MNHRPKLKDIADALNVSITTVSRALNNKSDINISTKQAILAKANELNYKPNNLALSLRKSSSLNVIGVIVPLVQHYYFSTLLNGIMSSAHDMNYFVLVGESMHDSDREKKILDDFTEYGVSGILLAPCKHSDFSKNVLPIIHRRIPVVVMDRMYDNYNGNFVNTDDSYGAFIAVNHLIDQGYKRIAHIASSDSWSIGQERLKGYKEALTKNGIPIDENYLSICHFNNKEEGAEEGYKACHKLFSLKEPPDAIFSVTDDIAIGVYQYAKENNISIPNDLGIVGFSNSDISNFLNPKLSTLEQYAMEMGQMAFDFFLRALESNGQIFQNSFKPKLLIRGSSKKNNELGSRI
jgi:LacI family transcriptional regulator